VIVGQCLSSFFCESTPSPSPSQLSRLHLLSLHPSIIRCVMHCTTRRLFSSNGPVTAAYLHKVKSGALRYDGEQIKVACKLDNLHSTIASLPSAPVLSNERFSPDQLTRSLASAKSKMLSFFAPPTPTGIYIYGSVGVGKSFLMDIFYNTLQDTRKTRRVHFHEFMLRVHARLFEMKTSLQRGASLVL
jgi:protein AFG1